MKKVLLKPLIAFLFFSFLCGCSAQATKTTPIQTEPKTSLQIPTPGPESGVVSGQILDSATGKPLERNFFLSKNLTLDHPELPPLISFSYDSNPRAAQDDAGYFVFKDVPPGEYVLVLWSPADLQFVMEKGTDNPFSIKVEAGNALDLGLIKYP
jgi:hypothetical protein